MQRSKSLIAEVWTRRTDASGSRDAPPLCGDAPLDDAYTRVFRRPVTQGELVSAVESDEPDVPLAEIVIDVLDSLREGPRAS